MGCPSCGGATREPIAPGYWRCTSKVVGQTGGPGLVDTRRGPPIIETEFVCNAEYHEATGLGDATATCACGTFAIGKCAGCQRLICGTHSQLRADRRLCIDCAHGVDIAAAQAVTSAAAVARNDWLAARDSWDTNVRAELATMHPLAQVARVMRAAYGRTENFDSVSISLDALLISRLLPELFPSRQSVTAVSAIGNADEISQWLPRAARVPPSPLRLGGGSGVFGRKRKSTAIAHGWVVPASRMIEGGTVLLASAVTVDGRRLFDCDLHGWMRDVYWQFEPVGNAEWFTAASFAQMADIAQLPAIPPAPQEPPKPYDPNAPQPFRHDHTTFRL